MSQTVRANVITGGWGAAVKRRNATRALLRSYSVSVDQYSALHLGKLVLPMEEAVPTRKEAVPVSVRKAISLVREQTCTESAGPFALVFWPDEDCVSVVRTSAIPVTAKIGEECDVLIRRKRYKGKLVATGMKQEMDELENRYLLGEWTPLSDTPPPNIKDKNPQEQETPKKKRDGKKKRELMKEPTDPQNQEPVLKTPQKDKPPAPKKKKIEKGKNQDKTNKPGKGKQAKSKKSEKKPTKTKEPTGKILTISNHEPKPPSPSASKTKSTVSGIDRDSTISMLLDGKAKPPPPCASKTKSTLSDTDLHDKPPPPCASKTKSTLSDTDLHVDSSVLTLSSDETNSKAAEKTSKTDDSQDSSILSESSPLHLELTVQTLKESVASINIRLKAVENVIREQNSKAQFPSQSFEEFENQQMHANSFCSSPIVHGRSPSPLPPPLQHSILSPHRSSSRTVSYSPRHSYHPYQRNYPPFQHSNYSPRKFYSPRQLSQHTYYSPKQVSYSPKQNPYPPEQNPYPPMQTYLSGQLSQHSNFSPMVSAPSHQPPTLPPSSATKGQPPRCLAIKELKANKRILSSSEIVRESLSDPAAVVAKYSNYHSLSKVQTLAQKLANQAYFGENVLRKCIVMGFRDYPALPQAELNELKQTIFNLFPQYWANPIEFEATWSTCTEAIGQLCKRLRSNT